MDSGSVLTASNSGEVTVASGAREPALDGFRGCAVLAIVFLHYVVHHIDSQPGALLAYAQKYLMVLWLGVDAFFVLSGYLIGGILLDQRASGNLFRVFYSRRALRIFPAYLALLAFWWCAKRISSEPGMPWLMDPVFPIWPYFFYVQNFFMAAQSNIGPLFVAATWSLAIEEQFYMLFPLVVRMLPARSIAPVFLAGIAVAPILRIVMAALDPNWGFAGELLLPTRWDSLLLGATVAWIVRNAEVRRIFEGKRLQLFLLLYGAGFCVALVPFIPQGVSTIGVLVLASGKYLVIAGFFALILLFLHLGWMPRLARFLSNRPLRHLGRISYAVYLFHMPILGLCFAMSLERSPALSNGQDWAVACAAFLLTLVSAQATWTIFENRLIGAGHRLTYQRTVADSTG